MTPIDRRLAANILEITFHTSRFLEVEGARVEDLRGHCLVCGASAPVPLDLTIGRQALPLDLPHRPDCRLVFAFMRAVAAHLS